MIGTLLNQRYQIEAELGRGGMGVVYRARDTILDRDVAIKMVSGKALDSQGRARLMQEARLAAGLNHPNIVAVHDVGETISDGESDNNPFIIMELIEGRMLRDYQVQSVDEVIDIGQQICAALALAHEKGIIHRDLKPENVALTSSRQVKLMDFGLARSNRSTRITEEGAIVGTISYLAPELIMGQPASPQSDLYALGVMLYELAAKRPPFDGDNLTAVLSQHLHAPIVPPSAFNDDIPPFLDALIVKLLSKEAIRRPASANEVSQSLNEQPAVSIKPSLSPERALLNRLVRGRLIGREQEFEQAQRLWQQAVGGAGQMLFISGEPGIGKTRFVQELITLAEMARGHTLRGDCYAEGALPYEPFSQIIRAALRESDLQVLSDSVQANLAVLAPELAPEAQQDTDIDQNRLFESVVSLCNALTKSAPLLLFIDDLHWADSGTLSLLRHLARRTRQQRLLIVATYREVDLDESRPFGQMLLSLNREQLLTRLKLTRLSRERTRDLLAVLFDEEITSDFLAGIYRETEGNPFFIEEVCKALVESGALYHADGRWHRPDMSQMEIPQGVRVAIQSRLARLSEDEQQSLQVAALLGRDFEYDMLHVASQADEDELIDVLEHAEQAQLIAEVATAGRRVQTGPLTFTFTHALIRTTLLDNLSTLRRQRLQRQVALKLEEAYPARLTELAPLLGHYFAEAGDGPKAVQYLLQAGDAASRLYAHEEAATAYEQALLFLKEEDDTIQAARTLMKLGLAYHNSFAFDKAQQAYEEGFTLRRQAGQRGSGKPLPPAPHAFRVNLYGVATIDPAYTQDTACAAIIQQLFSGLVELNAEGDVIPDVAARWEILDNGRRYRFYLRDDVFWSDGVPVMAADFVYGWRRVLDPAKKENMAALLYDIVNARDAHQDRATDPASVGVKAVGEKILEIHLEQPSSYFLYVLADAAVKPVPRHVVSAYGDEWTKPETLVVNGPFQLAAWDRGEKMVLARNPRYHGRFSGNVERVAIYLHSDMSHHNLLPDYNTDKLDYLTVNREWVETARQQQPGEYIWEPALATYHIGFSVTEPPFVDPRVRRALALAIDKKMLSNLLFKGMFSPATGGFTPPGVPGHVADIALPYDPEQARRLLAQAGYPGGRGFPALTLVISASETIARHFESQWYENLGISIQVKRIGNIASASAAELGPFWIIGWVANYPDPDSFLRIAGWRSTGQWRHERYEQLIEGARRLSSHAERMQRYRQAEEILVEEVPVVPLAYGRIHFLVKPWVKKNPSTPLHIPIWKDTIIEPH